ncbi:nuclear transport factor 2 family protein [Dinghuibacter silviterrae]|uniref:SnoaL-like protein n=1 Tax=Dinghuibacter silviterrae TaxID=1539049 RepID=A0A4R8DU19_9BACT|nr:nuclear transport factor 2 family protein [Dinghuibacter silviterrae]TDX01418.1 SnoaL-like protein [Dinghuibacter silviterrae]
MNHELYAAFNARDLPTLLARMHPDVEWPKAWDGGYAHGPEQVRDYWVSQWKTLDPKVTPTRIDTLSDGRVRVTVHQVVHGLDGALLVDTTVVHLYTLEQGLIRKMDILELCSDAPS